MKTPIFFRILVATVVAMVLAATQWLPVLVGATLGQTAFTILLLSAAAWVLRLAGAKKKAGAGFFYVGLVLLLVPFPWSRSVTDLFLPAGQIRTGAEVPLEIVLGLLGIACIFRAWMIWASEEEA